MKLVKILTCFLMILTFSVSCKNKNETKIKIDQIPNGFYGWPWGSELNDFKKNLDENKQIATFSQTHNEIGMFDIDFNHNTEESVDEDRKQTEKVLLSDQASGEFIKALVRGFKTFSSFENYQTRDNRPETKIILMQFDMGDLFNLPTRFQSIFYDGEATNSTYIFYDDNLIAGIDAFDEKDYSSVLDLISKSYKKISDVNTPMFGNNDFMEFGGKITTVFDHYQSTGEKFNNNQGTSVFVLKTTWFYKNGKKADFCNLIFTSDDYLSYMQNDYQNTVKFRTNQIQKKYGAEEVKNYFSNLAKYSDY